LKNVELNLSLVGAAPHPLKYDWMQWPENEPWSLEFLRALSASQEGASTIPECLTAASRISVTNEASWCLQWKRLADDSAKRAMAAQRGKNQCTAQNNWLRASHYYRTAESQIIGSEPTRFALLKRMQSCSRAFLDCLNPKGESVRIALAGRRFIDAYFLPAPGQSGRSPVVICVGGPGHVKDDHLFRLPRHAQSRGLSLLMVELPGQGDAWAGQPRYAREIEDAITACVDYLGRREDVDVHRIGIFGDGLGAAFASRAAASDGRFQAAVCDAGIWDLHERAFVKRWISRADTNASVIEDILPALHFGIARKINCPIFVVLGEREAMDVALAVELCGVLRKNGSNISMKVFAASEAGLVHGQIESPTIANEAVFDWLSDCLRLQIPFAAKPGVDEPSKLPPAYSRAGLLDQVKSAPRRRRAVARRK
jgi:dienelactone hydrolase